MYYSVIMISYKKINIFELNLTGDLDIEYEKKSFNMKSPIIHYKIDNSKLILKINKDSDNHNIFYNICGYIERLFNIKAVDCRLISEDAIIINIHDSSKFYDENSKNISRLNFKKEGKMICSFSSKNGEFILKQCLLLI